MSSRGLRPVALIGETAWYLSVVLLYFSFFDIGESRIPVAGEWQ